ncbi:hypothetical protein QTV43_000378 [Vibrio vulnificus]|nr:hypothetical protein [Vibrio vulnificus]
MKNYLKLSVLSLMVLGISACGSSSESTSHVEPDTTPKPDVNPKPDPTPIQHLNEFDLNSVQLIMGEHRTYSFDWQDAAKTPDQNVDYKICKEKLSDPNFCIELGNVADQLSLTLTTAGAQYPRFDRFFIRATDLETGAVMDSARAKLLPHEYAREGQGFPISASSSHSYNTIVMSYSGDTMAVSDYVAGSRYKGMVTMYEKQPDNTWAETAVIGGSDKKNFQQFGEGTLLSNDGKTLIVPSRGENFTYKYSCETCMGTFNSHYPSGAFEVLKRADDGSWTTTQIFDYTDLPAEYAGTMKTRMASKDFNTLIVKSSPSLSGPKTKEAIFVFRKDETTQKYEVAIVIDADKLGDQITNFYPYALNDLGSTLLIRSSGNNYTLINLLENNTYDVGPTSKLLFNIESGEAFTPKDLTFSPYGRNLLIWGYGKSALDGESFVGVAEVPFTDTEFGEPKYTFVDMSSGVIEADSGAFVRDYNGTKLLLARASFENYIDGVVEHHVVFDLNQPNNPEVGRIQTRWDPELTEGTPNGGINENFVAFSGDMSTTTTYVTDQSRAAAY